MAIVRITRAPMLDRATYRTVDEVVGIGTRHPLGLILHTTGSVDDAFQTVQVWESPSYAAHYERETVAPAVATVLNGTGAPPSGRTPAVTVYEADFLVTP